jgi:hypothetical protein
MSYGPLDRLLEEEFDLGLTFYSTPRSLRRQLLGSEAVAAVRMAIGCGVLTENTASSFVNDMLRNLKKGERFPHESALAGLAVAIEDRYTPFADHYLKSLASLKLSEMVLSIGVARLCLEIRPARTIKVSLGPSDVDDDSEVHCKPLSRWYASNLADDAAERTPILRPTGTDG